MVEVSETAVRRLLAVLVPVAFFVGCEDDPVPTALVAGANSGGKPPVELVCPSTPINGTACNATLFCTYPVQVCPGQIANTTASCVNGRWLVSQAVRPICEAPYLPMPFPCPGEPPSTGMPCPTGGIYTTSVCGYATPECPSVAAYCQTGEWLVVGCGGAGGTGGTGGGGAGGEAVPGGAAGQPDGGQTSLGGAAWSPD